MHSVALALVLSGSSFYSGEYVLELVSLHAVSLCVCACVSGVSASLGGAYRGQCAEEETAGALQ